MNIEVVGSSNNAESPWDSFQDTSHDAPQSFEGETGNNSETGKERTFSEMDLYPKMKGETNEQYGKRLRMMHEKTAAYEAEQAEKEYLASDFGQKETAEQQKLDRLRALQESRRERLGDEAADDEKGRDIQSKIDQSEDRITGYRLDYKDSQTVGTPEEQEAYKSWLEKHEDENQENLARRGISEEPEAEPTPEPEPESKSEPKPESTPEPESKSEPESEQPYRTAEQDRQAMVIENEDDMLKRTRTKEYLESDFGKEEQEVEAEFDRYVERLYSLAEKGIISVEDRDARIERATDENIKLIDSIRAKYEEAKKAELIDRFIAVNKMRIAQMEAGADPKEKLEAEEKARLEAEEKAKLEAEAEPAGTAEEGEAKTATLEELLAEKDSIDAKLAEIEKKDALLAKMKELAEIDAELAEIDEKLAALDHPSGSGGLEEKPESAPHQEEGTLAKEIKEKFSGIPEKGLNYILAPNTANDSINSVRFSDYKGWWETQDDGVRQEMVSLVKYLKSNKSWNDDPKWGSNFINWLELVHPEVFK